MQISPFTPLFTMQSANCLSQAGKVYFDADTRKFVNVVEMIAFEGGQRRVDIVVCGVHDTVTEAIKQCAEQLIIDDEADIAEMNEYARTL